MRSDIWPVLAAVRELSNQVADLRKDFEDLKDLRLPPIQFVLPDDDRSETTDTSSEAGTVASVQSCPARISLSLADDDATSASDDADGPSGDEVH